jgi:type IV pilus assembly protein PilM
LVRVRTTALRKGQKYTPIGIDVRESSVHAVQFASDQGNPKVHVAATEPIVGAASSPAGVAPVVMALKSLVTGYPFVGRDVIGSVPSQDVDVRPIRLPEGVVPGDDDHFRSALNMEARSCLLYSPEEAVLDYVPLGVQSGGEGQHHSVLLVAVKKESVNGHLALLRAAGLNCVHLDVVPCAAARILGNGEATHAAIDLDRRQTVVLMARGADLLFSRTIKFGFQVFVDEVMRTLNVDEVHAEHLLRGYGIEHGRAVRYDLQRIGETGMLVAESMRAIIFEVCSKAFDRFAGELRRSIDYFALQQRGGAIERVVLMGEFVPPGLGEFISDRLSIPAALTNALSRYGADESALPGGCAYTIAAGLALREESG